MLKQLEKLSKLKNKESYQAQAQLDFYVRNGYLTSMMKKEANRMIDKNWPKIKPKTLEKRHYLYALSDGEYIKIGMSCDIDKRIKTLQTGSPRDLKKVWASYAGEDNKVARKQERKLHRALKPYHVTGEWFNPECMDIVNGWRVRNLDAKHEEEAHEINDKLDTEVSRIIGDL